MVKTFKYRIYPTRKQIIAIEQMIETHRIAYNSALAGRKQQWESAKESVTYKQQSSSYRKVRESNLYLQQTNFGSVQRTLRRLDKAFKAFFRRLKAGQNPGYPRFKGRNRFDSVEFTYGDGAKIRDNGKFYIQYIGEIRLKQHRPIEGAIKTAIIRRQAGRYYVCFTVETQPEQLPKTGAIVGLDMGISSLVTTSDGEFFDHPKHLRNSERKLRRAQRKVARRKKSSNRRSNAVRELQRVHVHIANQRRDTAHKITRQLVADYDVIVIEKLVIQSLIKNHHLAKSITDASWNIFALILAYKVEETGKQLIKVDAKNTSQICSSCGIVVKKDLSVRTHSCPNCGLNIDRDVNAAKNILARGLDEAFAA